IDKLKIITGHIGRACLNPIIQMGLLLDFSPENMMASNREEDQELEAEFLAIVGNQPDPSQKPNGKTPLPMEAIEKMAALCMKDLDEEDGVEEEDLEDDDELMVTIPWDLEHGAPAASSTSESILLERLAMYKVAVANAKQAGENSKMRRYERGLKTLENLLTSVRKGKKIDEDEIPPPVATGKGNNGPQTASLKSTPTSQASTPEESEVLLCGGPRPVEPAASRAPFDTPNSSTQAVLQARVREYKLAALHSKQEGNIEMATKYYRLAKSFEPILDSLGKGEAVDLSNLPPPPGENGEWIHDRSFLPVCYLEFFLWFPERPAPPRDMMEALQQRMDRYKAAAAQAKSKGEDRKARMHERIVKQYQEAIKAHKAGKTVEFADLPVPPGFPPIQGMESLPGDQSLGGILETAMKLVNEDEDPDTSPASSKPAPSVQPKLPHQPGPQAAPAAAKPAPTGKTQQQLTFLENRKKQLKQAALRAKQQNDIEGAKLFLCQAKGLDPMIEASKSGLPVDISKATKSITCLSVPHVASFLFQMCISYSKQFTHLGNITETIKFEKMQRTFSMIKIFPELNSNDMILSIVKGINLPAPPGFKRAIQSKGIKFEVAHKGGLFKNDRVVGTAQLKLEALETKCELREILELLDGRRPTGGRLEVIVRLREPLTSQQLETTTEKWLVIDPLTGPPVRAEPPCTFQRLFSVTAKPPCMALHRILAQSEPVSPKAPRQWFLTMFDLHSTEYLTRLEQYHQWYTEAARRLGNDGKRVWSDFVVWG
uniref:Coiled-coil and C2 domain containing 1A n=1 Tax=Naja naja TaxID=35670 RepID=A0A8C6YG89_NAJNA